MYNVLPIWTIALGVAGLLFATSEGAWLWARRGRTSAAEAPFEVALSPAFTLVALLLGFVFSMALSRYDARCGAVLHQANAIRTVSSLTHYLDASTSASLRPQLLRYVEARLAFALADANPAARRQAEQTSEEVQKNLEQLTAEAYRRNPQSASIAMLIGSLQQMADLSVEESATLSDYIPPAVMIMLVLISVIASGLMGFQLGCRGQRGSLAGALLAAMLALILGTIIDLDQPQRGFIRVNLEPLRAVQRSLQA